MHQAASSPVAERTLIITRVLNAPRSLVFQAWTDPKHLAQWWGPSGFTNPLCQLDLKPFGEIRIDMRGPDGAIYPMAGAFREIVDLERLVFTSAAQDESGKPIFENLNTVTFEEFEGNKTLLTVDVRVLWESLGAERYLSGMSLGWRLSIDRLNNLLVDGSVDVSDREICGTRLVKAPRELVYRMWTEAEHIKQWWGPRGFSTTIEQMDVRPGGEWRFIMHGPDGTDYRNNRRYDEVVPPERLVMENLSWPHHWMIVSFVEAEGGTVVIVRMVFEEQVDREKVAKEHGAVKGLAENLDRLQEHLDRL